MEKLLVQNADGCEWPDGPSEVSAPSVRRQLFEGEPGRVATGYEDVDHGPVEAVEECLEQRAVALEAKDDVEESGDGEEADGDQAVDEASPSLVGIRVAAVNQQVVVAPVNDRYQVKPMR